MIEVSSSLHNLPWFRTVGFDSAGVDLRYREQDEMKASNARGRTFFVCWIPSFPRWRNLLVVSKSSNRGATMRREYIPVFRGVGLVTSGVSVDLQSYNDTIDTSTTEYQFVTDEWSLVDFSWRWERVCALW